MAFRPEAMQRTLLVSSKAYERPVIETLHDLHAAHLIEFTEDREGEFGEFRLGRPLEEAGPASDLLVRIRGLLRGLGMESHAPQKTLTVDEVQARLDQNFETIEQEIQRAVGAEAEIQQKIDRIDEEASELRPFRGLPLHLEDYRGYESLRVFVGTADGNVRDAVARVTSDFEFFRDANTGVFALFVKADARQAVADVLLEHRYKEMKPPQGEGAVDARLSTLERERGELEREMAQSEKELDVVRAQHGDFLVAAEEHLAIEVNKAEAPLAFASTDHAFVVDAWVPQSRSAEVEARLREVTGDNVYFTITETRDPEDAHGGHGHGHDEEPEEEPPVEYHHPKSIRPFQFFTEMFSTPKYNEIDPTAVLAIAFPLFFGFMIGDLGLGILMVGLGWVLFTKMGHIPDLKGLGYSILIAGVIAALFGGFVFMDAFGIPLAFHEGEHLEHVLHVEGLDAPVCSAEFYQAMGETSWTCLLGMGGATVNAPISKVADITTMLAISLAAAFVHLGLGLLIGLRNEAGHDKKHAFAKVGWLILLFTFFPATIGLITPDYLTQMGVAVATTFQVAGVGAVVGGIVLAATEGFVGVIEIPSVLSNIVSYARLGAIAIAKGAMAIAFNDMFLVNMALSEAGILLLIVGLVLTIIAQSILFVLGMLSAGIQAIRLNFVEFFTKFYNGGGRRFNPFGSFRKYTT